MSKQDMGKNNRRWRLGSISLAIALMFTDGNLAQAQTAPASVQQGYRLLDRGAVNEAVAAFRQAVQRYPQSVEARLGLAIAYQQLGQDASAWQAYQQVLAQDPNNRQALTAVGVLGGYRPEWQAGGIAALTTLLSLDTDATVANDAARAQRALLYGYQSRFPEALADYQRVLQGDPAPAVILGAAQIYTYSGDYSQGLALFDRYLATGKSIPNSGITAYALALQETGKVSQAVQVLTSRLQALRGLDETTIQIRAALAIAHQENQQPQAALSVLAPLRDRPEAMLPLARALSAIARQTGNFNQYDEAVALYQQVLERTANPSAGLVTEAADVLSESPSAQAEALRLYEQLTAQQPQNQSLQVKRWVLASQLGQVSRTDLVQQLQAALQPLPTAQAEQRSIALALLRLDSPAPDLLPLYQQLTAANVPFLNFRIAQIFMQQGDFTAARQALATYSAINAQDPAPELLLAEIDRREGNLDRSAQSYAAIIASNPNPDTLKNALRGLAGIRLRRAEVTTRWLYMTKF
jgi:cellulose synthase operon protein C